MFAEVNFLFFFVIYAMGKHMNTHKLWPSCALWFPMRRILEANNIAACFRTTHWKLSLFYNMFHLVRFCWITPGLQAPNDAMTITCVANLIKPVCPCSAPFSKSMSLIKGMLITLNGDLSKPIKVYFKSPRIIWIFSIGLIASSPFSISQNSSARHLLASRATHTNHLQISDC